MHVVQAGVATGEGTEVLLQNACSRVCARAWGGLFLSVWFCFCWWCSGVASML